MSLLRAATIPLNRDLTGRFLPLILAILVLLASIMLSAALLLGGSLSGWRSDLEGRVSVQIMPLDARAQPFTERVEAARQIIAAQPGVTSVAALDDEAMGRLLSPWLGQGTLPADLPVPALLDVQVSRTVDMADLRSKLANVAGAQLDDHGTWLADVRRLAEFTMLASYGLVLLILLAAALVLVLLVRAGMNMHRDVVELLHLVGASDAFIIRQFQRHMLWVAGLGAVAGAAGSALLLALLHASGYFEHLPWWALPVMPLLFLLLADLTTRLTVRRLLDELP